MCHGGVGAVLHGRARPQGHLVAVAGVHHVAVAVEAAEELAVAQRLRGVVGEHLAVAGDVARGEDDAPRGVDEDGVAALVGGVDARHAAGLVLGELLGAAVEEGLRAGRLGGLERAVHGPAVVGQDVDHAGEAGVALLAPVVVVVDGEALGEDVGRLGVGGRVGVAGEQLVLDGAHVPVQVGAGVGDPVVEQLRVRAVAHRAHELVDDLLRLGLLDAELPVDLAAERAELAGAVAEVRPLLDADGLGARLRRLAQGADARQPQAHDAHLALVGPRDVRLGDGVRRHEERRGEGARLANEGRVGPRWRGCRRERRRADRRGGRGYCAAPRDGFRCHGAPPLLGCAGKVVFPR